MTLRKVSIAATFLLALSIVPATAQDGGGTFGIGVGVNNDSVALYFPIQADGVKFEPQFGLSRSSTEVELRGVTSSRTTSTLELGIGIFGTPEIGENTIAHLGGRLGIFRRSGPASVQFEDSGVTSTDFFIGPAAGGEHFLSEHLSLGVEGRIFYINVGQGDTGEVDVSTNQFETGGTFFVRIYF